MDLADPAVSHQARAVRPDRIDGRRSDRLHARAESAGGRDHEPLRSRADFYAAEPKGCGQAGDDLFARLGRRRELDGRGDRSGNQSPLHSVGERALADRPGQDGKGRLAASAGEITVSGWSTGFAAGEAAVRAHHGDRYEQGRARVDGPEWGWPAQSSFIEGSASAAARAAWASGSAADQDLVVRRGG